MFERTRAAVSRLRWVIQRRPVVDDLDAELQAHAELLVERYVASGMPSDEARLAAKRQLGNTTLVREDVHHMNTVAWLEAIAADCRYAVRSLLKDRAFSVVAIATLALGLGANAAIVSVVHAVLVKPLPYSSCHAQRFDGSRICRVRPGRRIHRRVLRAGPSRRHA